MKSEKNEIFVKKLNFLFFKILLWGIIGILFTSISIVVPTNPNSLFQEWVVFLFLVVMVNANVSFLLPITFKKSNLISVIVLFGSVVVCVLFEMFIFYKNFDTGYLVLFNKNDLFLITLIYVTIRNFALFIFFVWVEYFNQLILYYCEREKIIQQQMSLLIEKQEFEKKYSRKKLVLHYFFNILDLVSAKTLENNVDFELIDKVKFILYYFLVDTESESIVLEKELAFYRCYIELENMKHRNNIGVNFTIHGNPENYQIIPFLFEPLISNAMKYTKVDGSGWVDILVDATKYPMLNFKCKNNFDHTSIISVFSC